MKTKFTYLAFAFLIIFGSCKKNQQATTTPFSFQLQTQNATSGVVQWTAGTAHGATLTAITPSATLSNYNSTINQDLDLFSASTMGSVALPLGTYPTIQFQIELAPSATGSALHLEGIFNDGTNMVPVKFDIPASTVLQAIASNVAVASGSGYKVAVTIDLDALTQGVSTTDLTGDEQNGEVDVSDSINAGLYSTILANLQGALSITIQ